MFLGQIIYDDWGTGPTLPAIEPFAPSPTISPLVAVPESGMYRDPQPWEKFVMPVAIGGALLLAWWFFNTYRVGRR